MSVMTRRHLCGGLGGTLAVWGLATFLSAATLDLTGPKEMTKNLTARNVSALITVSTAVPKVLHIEVIEFIQVVQSSRERIILVLDRVENGLYPSEEGMKRARSIAKASAQKEKDFLEALMDRVPAQSVPKLEEALTVSAESWQAMLSAFQLPKEQEKQELPQRPGFDFSYSPIPTPPPPRE
ncbi:MAG: hypothetical protein ACE5JQ_09915 [Candidatus Methylomirabilales bacterium]